MKTAKSYKIILLLTAFVMSLVIAFSISAVKTQVMAATAPSVAKYFLINGNESGEVKIEGDEVVVPVVKNDEITLTNRLIANDLEFSLNVSTSVTKYTVTLTAPAYDVNGNYNENTREYNREIEHVLTLEENGNVVITFAVLDNKLSAKVNGIDRVFEDFGFGEDYYRIANTDGTPVNVAIDIEDVAETVSAENPASFAFVSVDQKASDESGEYKQEFSATNFSYAKPCVKLNDSFYANYSDGVITARLGYEYTISSEKYAVMVQSSTVRFNSEDERVNVISTSKIKFIGLGEGVTFDVGSGLGESFNSYKTFTVNVVRDFTSEDSVPVYNLDENAIESFKAQLNKNLYRDADKGEYIPIGSSQYLTIPSMKSMVNDNAFAYEDLTYTVHYKNISTSSTYTSALKVPVVEAGKYIFFVVWKDGANNSMSADDFYTVDTENGNEIIPGRYFDYVFEFEIYDNGEITVEAQEQSKGYVGTVYTIDDFIVNAYNPNKEYSLYFSTDKNATDGWKEIASASSVSESTYEGDYFTYEEIQSIGYNGTTKFTPIKTGYYKVVLKVTSGSSRTVTAETEPILVINANRVENYSWIRNNVWSIVFLSVGTLCLIGIIVLLCIKPKEDKTEEDKKTNK